MIRQRLHHVRGVTQLGLRGALVNDCIVGPGGRYLDAPQYDEVWSALESLDVPLYLHSGAPPVDHWQVLDNHPEMVGPAWSWAAEVSGHALRLVFSGVFDRHPRATLILGHMGELLPFRRSRLDSRHLTLKPERRIARMPSEYLGTDIVFTNSGVFSPATLLGAVMFSVDYPYESSYDAVAGFAGTALSDSDRHKVSLTALRSGSSSCNGLRSVLTPSPDRLVQRRRCWPANSEPARR